MAPCRGSAHAVRGDYDAVVNARLHDIGGADGGDCGDDCRNQMTTSSGFQLVLIVIECLAVK